MATPRLRARFNAWLLAILDGAMDRRYGALKRRLLGEVPRRLVEIGPGSGANLRYYPRGIQVVAFEPGIGMHPRLTRRAEAAGIELDIRPRGAEVMDLADCSVSLVVGTLVLCTAANPAAVLAEIRRVLVPGGRLVFVEHVLSPRKGPLRGLQRLVRAPWGWAFEGCDVCRQTDTLLAEAGFGSVECERFAVRSPLLPIVPHIAGVATR